MTLSYFAQNTCLARNITRICHTHGFFKVRVTAEGRTGFDLVVKTWDSNGQEREDLSRFLDHFLPEYQFRFTGSYVKAARIAA